MNGNSFKYLISDNQQEAHKNVQNEDSCVCCDYLKKKKRPIFSSNSIGHKHHRNLSSDRDWPIIIVIHFVLSQNQYQNNSIYALKTFLQIGQKSIKSVHFRMVHNIKMSQFKLNNSCFNSSIIFFSFHKYHKWSTSLKGGNFNKASSTFQTITHPHSWKERKKCTSKYSFQIHVAFSYHSNSFHTYNDKRSNSTWQYNEKEEENI